MAEVKTTESARDDLAEVVLQRYRRAREYRSNYTLYQGRSVDALLNRGEHQYNREYTPEDAAMMERAFGFCPTRYYGVVAQKVNAAMAWKTDLVLLGLDSLFTVAPSPEPDIDAATKNRIREGIRLELQQRMAEVGIADPSLLLDSRGRVSEQLEGFLQEQAQALKSVEQARIVSAATGAAGRMQDRLRDITVEGGFRSAYMLFSQDQILHGRGIMRFPKHVRKPRLVHSGTNVKYEWQVVPTFDHVRVKDFYPVDDAPDLLTNSGNTERTYITKANLIAASDQEGYFKDQITKIVEEFEYKSRNWLDPEDSDRYAGNWWGLDETIPLLVHEGFFSGDELREYGVDGVDSMSYVSARIEVCGGRTIRCTLIEMPYGGGRSYFQATFNRTGTGVYDSVGMAAMLWDSEQRVNRLMHTFEHNIDWASRPPLLKNKSAFDNPLDADGIMPGGQYDVEERFGVTGSMPDSLRTMNNVSAQYHLIMTQVGAILDQADAESGLPSYAYSSQDFGRSSLGEYTQRMSNALRQIKMLAIREDIDFIEPAFTQMFSTEIRNDPELRVGQDVNIIIRGMTGLLREDVTAQKQEALIPLIMQGAESGAVPPTAAQYAVHQLLAQAGFPMEALGISDPVIDNALAVAANAPVATSSAAAGQQVPSLDGRSGPIPTANVAQPTGMSNLMQTGPIT